MTRELTEKENTEIRQLTEEELDQVTGGSSLVQFFDSVGTQPPLKITGSKPQGNSGGALNRIQHLANAT
jgi:bacteriocin-like protein